MNYINVLQSFHQLRELSPPIQSPFESFEHKFHLLESPSPSLDILIYDYGLAKDSFSELLEIIIRIFPRMGQQS